MSTFEVMGLRKYSRPDNTSKSVTTQAQSRGRGYLKDMLVSRFLTRHKLEISGPANNATRELEVRVQTLVIREFEKFMKTESFNQRSLVAFEKKLLATIKETLGDNSLVRIREQTAPLTQRRQEIKTSSNFMDGGYVRNSTSVAAPKAHFNEKLNQNVSLPAIRAQNPTRNSIERGQNSTEQTILNKNLVDNKFSNSRGSLNYGNRLMMGKSSNARMRAVNRSHANPGNGSIQNYSSIENQQVGGGNTLEMRSKTRQEKSKARQGNHVQPGARGHKHDIDLT